MMIKTEEYFYKKTLIMTIVVSFLQIISFALLYKILVHVNPQTFFGLGWENNFIDYLYFSVVTFTITGHGDIYPLTTAGRIIVSIELLMGIGLIAGIMYCNTKRVIAKRDKT